MLHIGHILARSKVNRCSCQFGDERVLHIGRHRIQTAGACKVRGAGIHRTAVEKFLRGFGVGRQGSRLVHKVGGAHLFVPVVGGSSSRTITHNSGGVGKTANIVHIKVVCDIRA